MKNALKSLSSALLSACLCLLASACCDVRSDPTQSQYGQIVQAGWFSSFAAGEFEGVRPISELSDGAAIGLGTFVGVDGELIILDGKAYRVDGTGAVTEVSPELETPFALSSKLTGAEAHSFKTPMTPALLGEALDKTAGKGDFLLAAKAEGSFSYLKLRAPDKAEQPYPALSTLLAKQHVFERKDVKGTLAIFRTPALYRGMNVPGYHMHFLSDDRKIGGHVLDFKSEELAVKLQRCDEIKLLLPESAGKDSAPSAAGAHGGIPGESVGK
jgi:acetolactate decarboxylase